MPTDDVVENCDGGSAVEEIAENFALEPNDIRAVLAYASFRKPA